MALQAVGSSPQLSMAGQVYWIGNDGNVYLHNADGTATNMGAANGTGTTANLTLNGATQIANPGNPGAASGGGATPAPAPASQYKPLNTGAVANTQGSIDQIPALLQAALASEDQTYANTNNAFDAQEAGQRGTYDTSTTTNQNNFDSNFMDSIRAGVKGLGGLFNILRGSGAAGGTAEDQVRDIVGGTTADDIRTGKDTHDANQGQLDSSLANFLTDLKGKRQANADTHANNRSAITRDENTQLQDLYSKMAGFYGDAGNTGAANDWLGRAGALTPTIAANTAPHTSAYDTAPVVIHAPNLTAFTAPSQPASAPVPQDGQVGSGIFTISKPKRDTSTPDASTAPVATAQGA